MMKPPFERYSKEVLLGNVKKVMKNHSEEYGKKKETLPLEGLCHNEGNPIFVILNPSPCVTLSKAKGLGFRLRVNSVKNLIESIS